MKLEEIRQNILASDEFVLSEIERIRYLYRLKTEIRYAQERHHDADTESVAEHIYGMHILAHYFLPLEDPEETMDRRTIFQLITWHDMDEIETGDTVSHWKTEQHKADATEAIPVVLARMPKVLSTQVTSLIEEYEQQETAEAKFTKAIDKAEPLFEVKGEKYKRIMHANKNRLQDHWETKQTYVENYPIIMRFVEVATDQLLRGGYFYEE